MSLSISGIDRYYPREYPARALVLDLRLEAHESQPFIVIPVGATLWYCKRLLTETTTVQSWHLNDRGNNSKEGRLDIAFTLSNDAIHFIEQTRGDQDLNFEIRVLYQTQNYQRFEQSNDKSPLIPSPYINQSFSNDFRWELARSKWVDFLKKMQWSEIELFELHTTPFQVSAAFKDVYVKIHQAVQNFRLGDYDGVLVDCANAFDKLASQQSTSRNKKNNYETLIRKIYPNDLDSKDFNSLLENLKGLCQKGRHSDQRPAPNRDDAEFILRTTLSIFSMMSRRM